MMTVPAGRILKLMTAQISAEGGPGASAVVAIFNQTAGQIYVVEWFNGVAVQSVSGRQLFFPPLTAAPGDVISISSNGAAGSGFGEGIITGILV